MPRILVIDDDQQIRKMLTQTLNRAGYEAFGAENGRTGLDRYRDNPADLVITDILMPEKEGIQFIIELKQEYPDAKVIAISGGGTVGPEVYLEMALELGAEEALYKPFDLSQLLEAIEKVLGGPPAAAQPA